MSADFGQPLEPQADRIVRAIDTWVRSPVLAELAAAFGFNGFGEALPSVLAALDSWSEAAWDSRRGGERQDHIARGMTEEQARLTVAAASELGMHGGQRPARVSYDLVAVLGGAGLAPLRRSEYARSVLNDSKVGHVAMLGSGRGMLRGEAAVVAGFAPGATTEFDLMVAAAKRVFGVSAGRNLPNFEVQTGHPFDCERVTQFTAGTAGVPVSVLWAATGRPGQRANTADTVRLLARSHRLETGGRILAVTSPYFVPFQHADLVSDFGLPCRATVETIGYPYEWNSDPLDPQEILQEIRSTVRAMRRLLTRVGTVDVR